MTLISGTYHLAIRRCRYYTSSGYPISLVLKKMVFPRKTMDLWLRVAAEFVAKWDFPHCCGAQDGRNYKVKVSSSLFFISISVLSLCNSKIFYHFILCVCYRLLLTVAQGSTTSKSFIASSCLLCLTPITALLPSRQEQVDAGEMPMCSITPNLERNLTKEN